MSPKAEAFLGELRALCRKHGVQLSVSDYDGLQLWPLIEGEEELHSNGVEDFIEDPAVGNLPAGFDAAGNLVDHGGRVITKTLTDGIRTKDGMA